MPIAPKIFVQPLQTKSPDRYKAVGDASRGGARVSLPRCFSIIEVFTLILHQLIIFGVGEGKKLRQILVWRTEPRIIKCRFKREPLSQTQHEARRGLTAP